ncbi:barstar family protein [Gordonia malaquae]|uniref:barstar family protein n=1 Tax=Gordonia malaquae TaxID=410332 RepID=UPI0030C785AF
MSEMDQSVSAFSVRVESIREVSRLEYAAREAGRYPVHIRGWQCLTFGDLFDEFAAAFQFPGYFGYNEHALLECLQDFFDEDIQYQAAASGLDLIIWHADKVLRDGNGLQGRLDLELFIKILGSAVSEIRSPKAIRSGFEPVSRSVTVYLQFDDDDAASDLARWTSAGLRYPKSDR